MAGRRLVLLLFLLAAIGLPAGALRAACAGRSCAGGDGPPRVPFCPLPSAVRIAIEHGYREGRSPDVLVVTSAGAELAGPQRFAGRGVAWPSAGMRPARVPLVMTGAGVNAHAEIPEGATLDRVAPTVAEIIGLHREHPDVRSGTAIDGVPRDAGGAARVPRLVVLVAWSGVGRVALEREPDAWPWLEHEIATGRGTLDADPGSVPLDPAAVLTTIGTGGLPYQHGVTASVVRNDAGDPTPAFGPDAPLPVIASLAEDLDETSHGRAFVGLVAPRTQDRGLIGGRWYLDPGERDDDVVLRAPGPEALERSERMLGTLADSSQGNDGVADVVGVVLDGDVAWLDRATARIADAAARSTGGRALVVVAGTGDVATLTAVDAEPLIDVAAADLPGGRAIVEDAVAGGVFLDQDVLADQGATGHAVVDAMLSLEDGSGRRLVRDAFQGFAVSFARYC
jgi:hypothetical protein